MYEEYYGFSEKPFSLTPDPKFLYRSESHANAFDLLQYAIRRREGFIVVTGDIGTGKTTLCRALLEEVDRTTFTALVLNPFMSEEDLLKRVLQDFGVISREEVKAGRLPGVSKQELVDTLYDFLLGLVPLNASAVLIIDEAQDLPRPLLEQIRILSNLETDKEKLLQIILVGQLNLQEVLRSPELRQLDQRVSIRYELKPLDLEGVAAYVTHRLRIAGGSASVSFAPRALERVHRLSGGIPRVINLICDRALLAGFSMHEKRITPEMVSHAARSLDLEDRAIVQFWRAKRRTSMLRTAAAVLLTSAMAVGGTAAVYERLAAPTLEARAAGGGDRLSSSRTVSQASRAAGPSERRLPQRTSWTILLGSYPLAAANDKSTDDQAGAISHWLEMSGYDVYYADVDLGERGRWRHVLAGTYTGFQEANAAAVRLRATPLGANARVVTDGGAVASGSQTPRGSELKP
jgi:type II secretory pathway predicted ATPase ExeA